MRNAAPLVLGGLFVVGAGFALALSYGSPAVRIREGDRVFVKMRFRVPQPALDDAEEILERFSAVPWVHGFVISAGPTESGGTKGTIEMEYTSQMGETLEKGKAPPLFDAPGTYTITEIRKT